MSEAQPLSLLRLRSTNQKRFLVRCKQLCVYLKKCVQQSVVECQWAGSLLPCKMTRLLHPRALQSHQVCQRVLLRGLTQGLVLCTCCISELSVHLCTLTTAASHCSSLVLLPCLYIQYIYIGPHSPLQPAEPMLDSPGEEPADLHSNSASPQPAAGTFLCKHVGRDRQSWLQLAMLLI